MKFFFSLKRLQKIVFSRGGSWKTYLESSEGFEGVRVRRKNIPKSLFTKILISLTSIGREN